MYIHVFTYIYIPRAFGPCVARLLDPKSHRLSLDDDNDNDDDNNDDDNNDDDDDNDDDDSNDNNDDNDVWMMMIMVIFSKIEITTRQWITKSALYMHM
jgi:hypothetical protein